MGKIKDLSGQQFGRLAVVQFLGCKTTHKPDGSRSNNQTWFWCQCECKNFAVVCSRHLRDGSTISCGCYQKDATTICSSGNRNSDRVKVSRSFSRHKSKLASVVFHPPTKEERRRSKTEAIEKLRKIDKTYTEIGDLFGVTRQAIYKFYRREKKHE